MTDTYELPELPPPWAIDRFFAAQGQESHYFTPDQMRSYGQECARLAREAELTSLADEMWRSAQSITPPSDRAGWLAHMAQRMRERAAAIRKG